MSIISREKVLHLAKLAKLDLTEGEVSLYQRELETILGFIDQLKDVDIDQLPPTEQVNGLSNIVREDKVDDQLNLTLDDLAKNATLKNNQFRVPRVNL